VAKPARPGSCGQAADDCQRALGRIETAQRAVEAITTGVTADEDQIVCLVLVRDTASLVTLAVADLNVHRTCEPQHPEIRLDLVEIEHDPYVPLVNQLLERGAAPRERERQRGQPQQCVAGVGPVGDHEDRFPLGQPFQGPPPLLELVEILRPGGEEHRNPGIGHQPIATGPLGEATGRHLVPQPGPGGARGPRGSATQARQDLRTEAGHADVAGAFSDSLAAGTSCLKASPT
jgi:hypothetical protein